MVTRTSRKFSQSLLLIFLAIFVIGSISFPSVHADEGYVAATVDDEDEETLDMDEPTVEKKIETEEKEEAEEKSEVVAEKKPEVVEKKAEPVPVPEPEPEPEPEPIVEEETPAIVEEETAIMEEEIPTIVEEVKEESTEAVVEEVKEESTEAVIQSENVSPNKISIPFLDKLTKQDVKKIAAFSLGAWGAATGVGWAMQQFGGDQKYD